MDRKILTDLAAKYVEEVMEAVDEFYGLKEGLDEEATIRTMRQRVMTATVRRRRGGRPPGSAAGG
jgi:hypothetical protein